MPETIRVLIADDEAEIRAALADLIAAEDSLELVGAARDAGEAVELAGANRPDVALLDVRMPGGGGLRAARGILRRSPETRVLALSAHQDRATVLQMLGAGAIGYLVKGVAAEEIVVAIERAGRGQTSVSSEVVAGVVRDLAARLQRERVRAAQVREKRARIRRAIGGAGLSLVYQPIFDLGRRIVVGHEALARFALPPDRPPDDWFAEAGEIALKLDLELVAIRLALPDLVRIPDDAYLSLNVSHRTAMSAELIEAIDATPVDRLVVEITEHEQVEDYDALIPALDRLRSRGGRIAIDDAGAGFASLQHTLRLSPDIIKLDISLTHRIDQQRGQRALAAALISFAEAMGMQIVAEGIETEAELDTLLGLGVRYGQGFFLARPAPIP